MANQISKKVLVLRLVLGGLLVFWMSFIFSMSGANGETSGGLSRKITEVFFRFLDQVWTFSDEGSREEAFSFWHFLIRKGAHFTEYAILCSLILGFLKTFSLSDKKAFFISAAASAIYAATDEFHQGFVDGRSPQLRDLAIDTAGAITGGLILWGILALIKHYKKRKEKNYELER